MLLVSGLLECQPRIRAIPTLQPYVAHLWHLNFRVARNPGPIPRSSRVGVKTSRSHPSVLMKGSRVRCSPLKAYLSVRNSPIRNDQAIEADLRRGELNSREAGTFRNAF
jgi:hypothetical protein